MKPRMIFHLPYAPDLNRASASQLRPLKMLAAFQKIGYEVDIVMGDGETRKIQIKDVKRKIRQGCRYDFMYSESAATPTLLTERHHLPLYPYLDFGFWQYCKRKSIPIGLFYRDIHWKFEEYNSAVRGFKKTILHFLYKYDLHFYRKFVNVLFFPSKKITESLPELMADFKVVELPPGIDIIEDSNSLFKESHKPVVEVIYVGGIGGFYDIHQFIKVVNEFPHDVRLTVCCREAEWASVKSAYAPMMTSGNVTVVHKKNTELIDIYERSDIGCLYLKNTKYLRFAMPMKLFEYLAYQKPVVAISDSAPGEFVKENDVGWSISGDISALREFFMKIIASPAVINEKTKNINIIKDLHTWEARARKVRETLAG